VYSQLPFTASALSTPWRRCSQCEPHPLYSISPRCIPLESIVLVKRSKEEGIDPASSSDLATPWRRCSQCKPTGQPAFTADLYTKSTRAHTQKDVIRGEGIERASVRRHYPPCAQRSSPLKAAASASLSFTPPIHPLSHLAQVFFDMLLDDESQLLPPFNSHPALFIH